MKLAAISAAAAGPAWDQLRPGIAGVLKRSLGIWTEGDVLKKIESGEWLLFAMIDQGKAAVVLVAELRPGTDGDIFDVGMCWGTRLHEWLDEVCAAFEVIALECGCRYLAFNGRPGWCRLAKSHDFEVNSMTFSKELSP